MAYFISINQVFVQMFQRILAFWEEWTHTRMILVDLQKTFDSLDHTVPLQKMECIGFKESVIRWFHSYLPNRKFFVTPEDVRYWTSKLLCSTRIYLRVAPLPNIHKWFTTGIKRNSAIPLCWRYLYLYQNKDVEKTEKVLNEEFLSLCEWFIGNKLSINFGMMKQKQFFLSKEKSIKTKHIKWRLLSKTAQYCRISWMLPWFES